MLKNLQIGNSIVNEQQATASFETSFEFIPTESTQAESADKDKCAESADDEFSQFFSTFIRNLNAMNLLEKDIDAVYRLLLTIVTKVTALNEKLINENSGFSPLKVKDTHIVKEETLIYALIIFDRY